MRVYSVHSATLTMAVMGLIMSGQPAANAQGRDGARGSQAQRPQTAQAMAPIDLTGYWVAVISEDWRFRMVAPAKGDYASIPLTPKGFQTAEMWDPAKDEAAHEQCRSYGAPGLMRTPTRLTVSWQNPNTLKVETDYGMQTRLFHFGEWKSAGGPPTWQGDSSAQWESARGSGARGDVSRYGNLKIVTTRLRPGYLRKNGVPYSANAILTEYLDLTTALNGDQWIVITSVVYDPIYLQLPFTTALHFKKEATGVKWDPTPCSSRR